MQPERSSLSDWTPEQVAAGRRWVDSWRQAGPVLERLRREEIGRLDTFDSIAALCGPADYSRPPFAPEPASGLVEQQRWFRLARRDD
jgi:hypothetical protein